MASRQEVLAEAERVGADAAALCELATELSERAASLARLAEQLEPERIEVPASVNGTGLTLHGDGERVRASAFQRVPRSRAVELALTILREARDSGADDGWVSPMVAAIKLAGGDDPARRKARDYFRGALSREMREMWEDGTLERADWIERGSNFRYRLKADADASAVAEPVAEGAEPVEQD